MKTNPTFEKPKPPHSIKIKIQEYEGSKYVRSTCLQVYNANCEEVRELIKKAINKEKGS